MLVSEASERRRTLSTDSRENNKRAIRITEAPPCIGNKKAREAYRMNGCEAWKEWKHEVRRQAGEALSRWSHALRQNLVKGMHEARLPSFSAGGELRTRGP
jgi:hypothetical protein